MDRRQEKTRNAIFDAFSALLTRNGFNNITVQDIIDAAGIGRTTFYAHFDTKDDLLKEMCASIFSHVFSETRHAENNHDFSGSMDIRTYVTHMLYHLRDSRFNILGILDSESGDLVVSIFNQHLDRSLMEHVMENVRPRDAPLSFVRDQISGSFINALKWWYSHGLKESPETMATYFMSVIDPIMASLAVDRG